MKKKVETTSPAPRPLPLSKSSPPVKETTIRFTVDLSETLHRKLSILAAQQGRKKAELVREWMEQGLKDVEG